MFKVKLAEHCNFLVENVSISLKPVRERGGMEEISYILKTYGHKKVCRKHSESEIKIFLQCGYFAEMLQEMQTVDPA